MGFLSKMSVFVGTAPVTPNRRQVLVTTAVAGGVFMIGLTPAQHACAATADGASWVQSEGQKFTALISILLDNTVVARSTSPDMGNGRFIGTLMMVREELRGDWAKVKGEYLPANRDVVEGGAYAKSGGLAFFSGRSTGKAVMTEIMQLAASTRERLIAATAAKWGIAADQVTAEMSMLINKASGESIPFADFAVAAAAITLAAEPTPRPRSEWTFLGMEKPQRMNLTNILNGSQVFGVDVQVPGMVYAALWQAPAQVGRLKSVNKDAALAMPGVTAVVVVDPDQKTPGLPEGVNAPFGLFAANARQAVIVDDFWQAQTALDVLQIEWDLSVGAPWKNTETVYDAAMAAVVDPKELNAIANVGDAAAALAGGADIEAGYLTPYMDQVNKEPLNGTCLVTKDRVEAWLPTQHPRQALYVIADETGVALKDVHVNQPESQAQGIAIGNWGMEANPNGGPMPYSGTTVATVEVTRRGEIYIPPIDLAFDTGGIINEAMVRAGMEGGTVLGLGSGMFGELNVPDGKVVEGNLDTYRVMRQKDTVLPTVINVHFGGLSGHECFSEIGEPPVGPAPAALAHAVFKLTGSWMRQMPFSKIAI